VADRGDVVNLPHRERLGSGSSWIHPADSATGADIVPGDLGARVAEALGDDLDVGSEQTALVKTRVFLLDDHEVVRRGVREMVEAEQDLEVVGEAGTAEEAYGRIPATSPHVAVLDMRLPDGDGIDVCREIRSKHPEIACLMLTSFSDDEAVYAAILAGAAGYLLKQVRGNDLVDGADGDNRDTVNCGPGVDFFDADPGDNVNLNNCEKPF